MVLSDPSDTAMSEAFRPSLEEALPYTTQEDCLDYIAQYGGNLSMLEANHDDLENE